jgi:methionyl aminopeptidase
MAEVVYDTLSHIHNTIEDRVLAYIRPGQTYGDVVLFIENELRQRCAGTPGSGIAFPVGVNVNDCVAHWSYLGGRRGGGVLTRDDVVKIDYGVHINGTIIDAAFTVCFNRRHTDLLEAARASCMAAAQRVSDGVPVSDVSSLVEQTVDGQFAIVKHMCGHSIQPYKIHGKTFIPNFRTDLIPSGMMFREGETYAIEPFLSDKSGKCYEAMNDRGSVSHYMFNYFDKHFDAARAVTSLCPVLCSYKTLAFNRRWLPMEEQRLLQSMVDKNLYLMYPPVYEVNRTAKTSHFETTVVATRGTPTLLKKYPSVQRYVLA